MYANLTYRDPIIKTNGIIIYQLRPVKRSFPSSDIQLTAILA